MELFGLTTKDGKWLGSRPMDRFESSKETFEYYSDANMEEVYKGSQTTMLLFSSLLKDMFGLEGIRLTIVPDDWWKHVKYEKPDKRY